MCRVVKIKRFLPEFVKPPGNPSNVQRVPMPMRGLSKWIVLLIVFLAGLVGLILFFLKALGGDDAAKAAAALQAVFAYAAIFPASAALMVALQSEARANQAEARAIASEAEANEVRKASLAQALETQKLAEATREQAQLMRSQEERVTRPVIILTNLERESIFSNFAIVNMGTQSIFIQYIAMFVKSKIIDVPISLEKNPSAREISTSIFLDVGKIIYPRISIALQGEVRPNALARSEIFKSTFDGLEAIVIIGFLSAETGAEIKEKKFSIVFLHTLPEGMVIREIPLLDAEA